MSDCKAKSISAGDPLQTPLGKVTALPQKVTALWI